MSGVKLLLSFVLVTLGWQLVTRLVAPLLTKRFYQSRLNAAQSGRLRFANDAAREAWARDAGADATNMTLLLLALICGSVAGFFNFPLIGFSRSLNPWSWLWIIALCGVSWGVALSLHAAPY